MAADDPALPTRPLRAPGRPPHSPGEVRSPFSLVLGAGGRPGLAFHAGTLLALQSHGLAAPSATSITGTSAGAIATAILAAGGTIADLVDYTTATAPREEFRDMGDLIHAADRRRQRIDLAALGRLIEVGERDSRCPSCVPATSPPRSSRSCRESWRSSDASRSSMCAPT